MLYPIPHPQDERWLFQSDGCARLPSTPSINHQSHVLTLDTLHAHLFIPVFNEYLGMFTNTLRHLYGTEQQLLYIIRQFPLSDDLSIVYPVKVATCPKHPVPTITQSPPLRGEFLLTQTYSSEFFEGLAALPGGLNFRSLELFRCGGPKKILEACGHTATSISYSWYTWNSANGESNSFYSRGCCNVIICSQ